MKSRTRGFRAIVFGLVAAAGLLLAPAAFAGHVSVGIGLPGLSVGYWGHGRGFVGVGVGGYYGPYWGGYYGGYYAPAPVYYAPGPVYYGPPAYARRCYSRAFYDGRGYYHAGYYHSC